MPLKSLKRSSLSEQIIKLFHTKYVFHCYIDRTIHYNSQEDSHETVYSKMLTYVSNLSKLFFYSEPNIFFDCYDETVLDSNYHLLEAGIIGFKPSKSVKY